MLWSILGHEDDYFKGPILIRDSKRLKTKDDDDPDAKFTLTPNAG